jgi:hypothetical protein
MFLFVPYCSHRVLTTYFGIIFLQRGLVAVVLPNPLVRDTDL